MQSVFNSHHVILTNLAGSSSRIAGLTQYKVISSLGCSFTNTPAYFSGSSAETRCNMFADMASKVKTTVSRVIMADFMVTS